MTMNYDNTILGTCIDGDPSIELEFYSIKNKKLQWKEGEQYILVGPTELGGTNSSDEYLFRCLITSETYCVYNDGSLGAGFATCDLLTPENNVCEDARKITIDVIFGVSITASIIAHFVKNELSRSMFGKMSLVYLLNILGQFLTGFAERLLDPDQETTPCILIAYFKQYFQISFFFSINILAFICYKSISEMNAKSRFMIFQYIERVMNPNKNSFLRKGIMYVQGIPLLISIATWAIDHRRKQYLQQGYIFDTTSYPEAGVRYCYMSYSYSTVPEPNYFLTPEFIYVGSVQILLMLSNIILFGLTANAYLSNIITPDNVQPFKQKIKNLKVLAKLFCVMIFLIISIGILKSTTHDLIIDYGIYETCILRFILGVPNALIYFVITFLQYRNISS